LFDERFEAIQFPLQTNRQSYKIGVKPERREITPQSNLGDDRVARHRTSLDDVATGSGAQDY
jgi:hypothetical protein